MKSRWWDNLLIILILFTPATLLVAFKQEHLLAWFVPLSILCALFIKFKNLGELEVFGLKAKMNKAIEDAYATIEQVKKIQTINTQSMLNQIIKRRYIFSNDVKGSIQTINSLISNSKELENYENVKEDCKKALQKLITFELSDLLSSINKSSDLYTKIRIYYHDEMQANIFTDKKDIPSISAIKDAFDIQDINNTNFKENFEYHSDNYLMLINEYEKHFEKIEVVNKIDVDLIKGLYIEEAKNID